MASNLGPGEYVETRAEVTRPVAETNTSGVSWGAVFGGAFVAAAIYLILLALGAGFGLSAFSPWSNWVASASAIGTAAIIWLIISEIVASGLGGYLTGRLRTKWTSVHTDEVFFRDTANGFIAWAVAVVASAAFLSTAAAAMAGGAAAAPTRPGAGTEISSSADPNAYYVDQLFRSIRPASDNDGPARAEASRILTNSITGNQMSSADQNYLAQMISARTGITQAQAEQRISDVVAQERQAADTARKAVAHLLLWMFVALLLGALSASYAATIGGRQRDHVHAAA
jgi:hypothetical protein